MKAKAQPQGNGFSYVMTVGVAVLLIVAAKTVHDFTNGTAAASVADARTATYFAAHSRPFCAFEGVWYDWEEDETIVLGCLEVKGNIREGSYSSTRGPRATSDFSLRGTYNIDSDSSMLVLGKDWRGKEIKFTTQLYVEDQEYPSHMIVVDAKGEGGFYIWKSKE